MMASIVSLTQSVRALQQLVNTLVQTVHEQDQRIGRLEASASDGTNVTDEVVARMVASALAEAEARAVVVERRDAATDPVEDALSAPSPPPPVPATMQSDAVAAMTTTATGRGRGRPKATSSTKARSGNASTVLEV